MRLEWWVAWCKSLQKVSKYALICKVCNPKMVKKWGPTFPQTGRIPGPTGQSKRYHEEGGITAPTAASEFDETDCYNFNFLA